MNDLDIKFVKRHIVDNIKECYIDVSNIHGFGLFAKDKIKTETVLCELDGQVLTWEKYEDIKESLREYIVAPYDKYFFMEWNALSENILLVRSLRTKYSYINHSIEPNVKVIYKPLRIITIRDIEKDEELTIDYRNEPLSSIYLKSKSKGFLYE